MTVSHCPHCRAALSARELEDGLCVRCMQRLPSPITADPPPPTAPEDRVTQTPERVPSPDPRSGAAAVPRVTRRPDPSRWMLVRVGLSLLLWGLVVVMIAGLGLVAGQAVLGPGGGVGPIVPLLALGLFGAVLVAGLMTFAGFCLCCAIPAESGGRRWATGTVVALVVSLVLFLVQVVLLAGALTQDGQPPWLPAGAAGQGHPLILLLGTARLAGMFLCSLCFFATLRAAAVYWGNSRLGEELIAYFVVSSVVPLGLLLIGGGLLARVADSGLPWIYFGFLYLWLLTLSARLRELIPTRPPRDAEPGARD